MQQFDWMGTLISWVPMLLIIGIWLFFMRQFRGQGFYKQQLAIQKGILEANQRQADALERLVAALDKRAP